MLLSLGTSVVMLHMDETTHNSMTQLRRLFEAVAAMTAPGLDRRSLFTLSQALVAQNLSSC